MRRELPNLQQQDQTKRLIEQDKINRQIPFDPQKQLYPADIFILVGFDYKGQPIKERNPRWHDSDRFYIGRAGKR